MSDTLTYNGYHARIEFDVDNRLFFGRVAEIDDGIGFHGDTVEDLVAAFHEAVDDYAAACAAIGKEPNRLQPGLLKLTISPDLHDHVIDVARREGQSIDQFGTETLQDAIARIAGRHLAAMGGSDPDATLGPRRRPTI